MPISSACLTTFSRSFELVPSQISVPSIGFCSIPVRIQFMSVSGNASTIFVSLSEPMALLGPMLLILPRPRPHRSSNALIDKPSNSAILINRSFIVLIYTFR
nr:MAG TPA: hypothetical protein [Caudoviricetes sp.]